jgi:ferrochelatase
MTYPDAQHPPVLRPRIGVLLVNLGTPDAPTASAVRRYLAEFLSDQRVIEIPRLLWQPILHGIILRVRPKKSAHAYRQVWTDDGSPLAAISRGQARAIAARFADRFGDDVIVDHAMRYGQPALKERIAVLTAAGCDRILIAPLYPQYCAATTASVTDVAFASLGEMRWQPAIRTLPSYHDHPAYIEALRSSIEAGLGDLDFVPDAIVASFHGMPRRTLDLGDPYYCQCRKTARLLSEALSRELIVTFQSRFGRAKWLEPATDRTLAELAQSGKRRIAVVAPGFSADCLETLEEIGIRGRNGFIAAGGEAFAYIPALNDSREGTKMLEILLTQQLEGWTKPA